MAQQEKMTWYELVKCWRWEKIDKLIKRGKKIIFWWFIGEIYW